MPDQLILDFPVLTSRERADFLVTESNAEAVAWLDRWPDWPGPALCLYGPEGCGKSHLLQLWCERANARQVTAAGLPRADLAALADAKAIAVDDADRIEAAEPFLHLYNLSREAGGHLLLTARRPPRDWPVSLPDLRSRLLAAAAVAIKPPDDRLLLAVMAKIFADRQVRVPPDVLSYVASRIERSFAGAKRAVRAIDAASLSGKRPITIPLAREALAFDVERAG